MSDSMTGTNLGDYELLDRIGKGGMGEVYRAHQYSLDRIVAIKILPHEFCSDHDYLARFLSEAKGAARLIHGNIIQVLDAGVADDIYFYVMEFVNGKNLAQIIKEHGRLTERDALYIIQESAKGLAYAHRMGVIHRDVKPENIMVDSRGMVKIGDLGLAKWKVASPEPGLTSAGATMGTPYYVSPEQIRGIADIDGRADIYSLGMTLYYTLAGRPPFTSGGAAEIMAQHLTEKLPPLKKYNDGVSLQTIELIDVMTAKNRDDRIPNMSEVSMILHEWLDLVPEYQFQLSVKGREETTEQLSMRLKLVGKWVAITICTLLVVLAMILGWDFYQKHEDGLLVLGLTENGNSRYTIEEKPFSSAKYILMTSIQSDIDDTPRNRTPPIEKLSNWISPNSLQPVIGASVERGLRTSKTLIKIRSGKDPNSPLNWIHQHASDCEGVYFEILPHQITPDCRLILELRELKKNWCALDRESHFPALPFGDNSFKKFTLQDLIKNPSLNSVLFRKMVEYVRHYENETNWEYASSAKNRHWSLPGASSAEKDYLPEPFPVQGAHLYPHVLVTAAMENKPIRFDVTRYFTDLKKERKDDETPAWYRKPGWVLCAVDGIGGFQLPSSYYHEEFAPRFVVRRKILKTEKGRQTDQVATNKIKSVVSQASKSNQPSRE